MKPEKKIEAIELRKKGESIKSISLKLGVSKGSVSLWVRNVELTKEQRLKLDRGREMSFVTRIKKERQKRLSLQNEGRELVKKYCNDRGFVIGCMLYWAEGSKGRGDVSVSTSDLDMLKIFVEFLIRYFGVKKEQFQVFCRYYTDLSEKGEPEKYWIHNLGLDSKNLRGSCVNYYPKSDEMVKKKYAHGKLKYGTCRTKINSVTIMQKIFGAIQELGGFNREEWLD